MGSGGLASGGSASDALTPVSRAVRGAPLPDLFLIGGMKCGSTSVAATLNRLDGWDSGRLKEPSILADSRTRSVANAWANYGGRRAGRRLDATTEYYKPPSAADFARSASQLRPDARVLLVVRDPVARTLSHVRHNIERGVEAHRSYMAAIAANDAYVECSRFTVGLAPWLTQFPGRVAVVQADKLFANDPGEHQRLVGFLDLDPDVVLSFDKLNSTGSVGNTSRARTLKRYLPGYDLIRPLIPSSLRSAAVDSLRSQQPSAETPGDSVPGSAGPTDHGETVVMLSEVLADELDWVANGCPLEALV